MTTHFPLSELTESDTAIRLSLNNVPPPVVMQNLDTLAHGLEQVRSYLGNKPMYVTSGYRSQAVNHAVGGALLSAHMQGWAADFVCPEYGTPLQIVQAISRSPISFDQCIQEGRWVHISFAPERRGKVLTAHFSKTGVTYTEGLV